MTTVPVAEAISIKGKSLRNRLKVIVSLIFVLPSAVVIYILYQENISLHFRYANAILLSLSLTLVLVGMVLLRQVFDELIELSISMKGAGDGKWLITDMKQNSKELFDISNTFNSLLHRLNDTTALLTSQTDRLNEEIAERMRTEEELKDKEKRLLEMAHYDLLTGLPNRELFKDHMRHMLAQAQRHEQTMAVMLLDLDNFKTVNDSLGHVAGDYVLQETAKRISGTLRESDVVARLGGDEFCIVLPNLTNPGDCDIIATKLLKTLNSPVPFDGNDLYVSTSIGISTFPGDGNDEHTLLKNADTAMYQAKELGKNTYQCYASTMSTRTFEDMTLGNDLYKAIENQEFHLDYQPQYDLSTGKIDGAEALIRWKHPILGVLPPMKFIPLAERTGLMIPIGEWILKTICAQIGAWSAAGLPRFRVSVNLSARQFREKELAQTVERSIREAGIDPGLFEVEITESIIIQDIQGTARTLHQLDDLGVRISVDDFGTGYSSLSYLKQFPIHTLKIDRSFIRDITTDPDDASIVTAVIAMAHSLRMNVIAEGVETVDQLEFLRSLDCDIVQGFLMNRPLSVASFSDLLAEENMGANIREGFPGFQGS